MKLGDDPIRVCLIEIVANLGPLGLQRSKNNDVKRLGFMRSVRK